MLIILILIGLILFYFFVLRKFKVPKIGSITLFTGGVKTGKSAVSLYFAIKTYKRIRFKWKIKNAFRKLFRKELIEEPLLYSTIPLANIEYCQLTREHFLRKVRLNYGSVVFIDEASLVADSMLIKDGEVNAQLLKFFKLFGHETKGGACIINSHCISDLHYAIKRTTSEYYYIHSLTNCLFFKVANMREERYSEDGTDLNVFNEDVEESLKQVIISNSIFKNYDCYCFSYLTDNLPIYNDKKKLATKDDLKAYTIPSFRKDFYELSKEFNNEKKDS